MGRVVVFPQPEGPRREKNSPAGTWRSIPSTAVTSANSFLSLLSSISPRAMGSPSLGDVESAAEVLRGPARAALAAGEEAPGEEPGRDDDERRNHHDRRDRVHGGKRGRSGRAVDPDRDGVRRAAAREPGADDEVVGGDGEDDGRRGDDRRRQQGKEDARERDERRGAKIGGRLLVLPSHREEPAADDDDDEGDRERHVPEDLGQRAGVDEGEDLGEDEEERDPHDDLRRDE